jgi:hypothetical protein
MHNASPSQMCLPAPETPVAKLTSAHHRKSLLDTLCWMRNEWPTSRMGSCPILSLWEAEERGHRIDAAANSLVDCCVEASRIKSAAGGM